MSTLKELGVRPGDIVAYSDGDLYEIGENKTLRQYPLKRQWPNFLPYRHWDTCERFSVHFRLTLTVQPLEHWL